MQLLSGTAVAAFALALRLLCASLMFGLTFGVHPLEYEHRKQVSGASLGTRCVWHWPSEMFFYCASRFASRLLLSSCVPVLHLHICAAMHACAVHAPCAVMVFCSAATRQTEFKTLQSVWQRVEPLVTLALACPGQTASQKGLYWYVAGRALVSTPGPPGVLRS